jgi:hypothetical protein
MALTVHADEKNGGGGSETVRILDWSAKLS